MLCRLFFFFKQKTAYEVRISDWSSDVCSSDLDPLPGAGHRRGPSRRVTANIACCAGRRCWSAIPTRSSACCPLRGRAATRAARSEEHTSELQSLMRISYAVFCLKKKKHNDY